MITIIFLFTKSLLQVSNETNDIETEPKLIRMFAIATFIPER